MKPMAASRGSGASRSTRPRGRANRHQQPGTRLLAPGQSHAPGPGVAGRMVHLGWAHEVRMSDAAARRELKASEITFEQALARCDAITTGRLLCAIRHVGEGTAREILKRAGILTAAGHPDTQRRVRELAGDERTALVAATSRYPGARGPQVERREAA